LLAPKNRAARRKPTDSTYPLAGAAAVSAVLNPVLPFLRQRPIDRAR
jgi:hypothetical protein